jgi:hypothetical protein
MYCHSFYRVICSNEIEKGGDYDIDHPVSSTQMLLLKIDPIKRFLIIYEFKEGQLGLP